MHAKLLDFLVCPECKGDLTLSPSDQKLDEILQGNLQCKKCLVNFPIIDGIPNMILGGISEDKQKTSNFFETNWKTFDTDNKILEELLPLYISPLKVTSFKDKFILEAGCGSGRNLIMAAKAGAKEVIGIDISGSVKIAYEKTKNYTNIHIIQADILKLPFRAIFDIIFSVGVLHHLPNPEEGFLVLVSYLKSGGIMAVSVYSRENNEWIIKYLNPIRRNILSKLPYSLSMLISFMSTLIMYPLIKIIYKPLNEIKHFKGWARKHLFYNNFLYFLSRFEFKLIWGQFWDQIAAPTAFYVSKGEIERWCKEAGLKNAVFEWRNRNCWNAVGTKKHETEIV